MKVCSTDNHHTTVPQHIHIDILTLSETHIIENIDLDDKNEPYKIQGYLFINRGRSKGESGRVGIFRRRCRL